MTGAEESGSAIQRGSGVAIPVLGGLVAMLACIAASLMLMNVTGSQLWFVLAGMSIMVGYYTAIHLDQVMLDA